MKVLLWAAALLPLSLALCWLILYPQIAHSEADVSRVTPVATTTAPVAAAPRTPAHSSATTTLSEAQIEVKHAVALAFPDVPAMVRVVGCESSYAQFWADGSPKVSSTDDVGVMQINVPTWGAEAVKLGLDIYNSEADNIAMGRIVYETQGLSAWVCAR